MLPFHTGRLQETLLSARHTPGASKRPVLELQKIMVCPVNGGASVKVLLGSWRRGLTAIRVEDGFGRPRDDRVGQPARHLDGALRAPMDEIVGGCKSDRRRRPLLLLRDDALHACVF